MSNSYFKEDLKRYFKHFKIPFIVLAIVLVFFCILYLPTVFAGDASGYYDSPNTERVYGDQRVFDYGEQLSDEEEAELEAYIHEAEKKICCDIVIVTLNESLKDYAPEYMAKYTMNITPDKYVMVYADKFWEDNKFGYDQPQVLDGSKDSGDGVILVDNLYREEETGKIYTWMGTTGICATSYSTGMIDTALDCFYDYVDYDYCKACKAWVNRVVSDMSGDNYNDYYVGSFVPVVAAVIATIIYFAIHIKSKAGKNTVNEKTYLVGNRFDFPVREDIFLRKSVTKHYNPPQSSGGGGGGAGGGHISGGGGFHGGGGHSR